MLTFRYTGADGFMVVTETLTSGMVGKEVKLEFSSDWDNLTKTAVFSAGGVTRDVVGVSDVVTIPAEVLAVPMKRMYVGVYGVAADGKVTPTIRAAGPKILPGADPSGDEGTDPTLPVWAQIQADVEALEDFSKLDGACYVDVESTVGTIGDSDVYVSVEAAAGDALNPVTVIDQTDEGVSEVSVWSGGNNLFHIPNDKSELFKLAYIAGCDGESISVTVTAANAAWFLTNPMLRCVPGDTFYYSWEIADYDGTQNPIQPLLAIYDKNGTLLTTGVGADYISTYQSFLTAGKSFTISNTDAAYVCFGFRAKVGSTDFPTGTVVKMANIMVARNVSGLAYEAYAGQLSTVQFDRTVYGGRYEWSVGKLTITHDLNGEKDEPEVIEVKKYTIAAVDGTNVLCSINGNTALAEYSTVVNSTPVNVVVEDLMERVGAMEENEEDEEDDTNTAAAIGWTTPEMYGAIGDGVTDDSDAIQAAIDAATAFSTVMFRTKTYCVSKPIKLNKKVNIDGQGAVLKATQSMDCVVCLTQQAAVRPYTLDALTADANGLATYGFQIGGDIDTTQITFHECVARNALSHGFYLIPLAYIVNFVECLASSNGGDGINAVATQSSDQINAVRIEKCSLVSNTGNGVATQGVSISISECDFEFNNRGLSIGGNAGYTTLGVWINNCHMEGNTDAHIYIGETSWCVASIEHCYFNWHSDEGGSAYIKVAEPETESTHAVILTVDKVFFGGESDANHVDGGGRLERTSLIRCGNVAKLVNMRFAHIETIGTGERFLPLSAARTELVSDNADGYVLLVPYDLTNALLRHAGAYVETDGTSATLRCKVETYGPDGTFAGIAIYMDATISGTGEYAFNILDNISTRIADRSFLQVTFYLVDAGDATTLVVKNPYITCYR